jgi:hypothetical protein
MGVGVGGDKRDRTGIRGQRKVQAARAAAGMRVDRPSACMDQRLCLCMCISLLCRLLERDICNSQAIRRDDGVVVGRPEESERRHVRRRGSDGRRAWPWFRSVSQR